ncbi:MAG: hypothetical protein IPK79_13230 [Vampirovibrionales bacterium]|nr:hypothetical protein [Vampirovibrionales bacterium]
MVGRIIFDRERGFYLILINLQSICRVVFFPLLGQLNPERIGTPTLLRFFPSGLNITFPQQDFD